jgi:hypothetical protein
MKMSIVGALSAIGTITITTDTIANGRPANFRELFLQTISGAVAQPLRLFSCHLLV